MEKTNIKPLFSIDDAQQLVLEHYGIDGTVEELNSYKDQNFLIEDKSTGARTILKIANASEDRCILEAQNMAMEHVARSCSGEMMQCTRVCLSRHGDVITIIKDAAGIEYLMRMVTYIPGVFWAELDEHTPRLEEDLGRFLGILDRTLAEFYHPALHRYLQWDLKNAADLEDYLVDIHDIEKRRLVAYFLQQFKTFVVPVFPRLRTGVIHNDANDYNILVSAAREGVQAIIDYGDMVHTYIICELAIAIAYAMQGQKEPLAVAARMVGSYHRVYELTEPEIEVLFHLVCTRLSTTLLMAAHHQALEPGNQYLSISVAPAWATMEKLIKISPALTNDIFRTACGYGVKSHGRSPAEILRIREQLLGKALSISYQKPLKIVRGAMQYLYDQNGRPYLDTVNNVSHVGHCHPVVVKAAQEQMAVLNTNTRYLHDHIVEYARQLTATLPEPLRVCFFVCTGSEANELALRMARAHTGYNDFVVLDHAYHGNTNSVIDISPYKFAGPGGKGCPAHVHKAIIPDVYRGLYKTGHPDPGKAYANDVQQVFKDTQSRGRRVAAFIHESLPGVAGQLVLPPGYLKQAYQYTRVAGAVCIADEVQVGFGRVGTHMWGFETQEVIPDIVTMGKPIGNGHPLAAVVTTPGIAQSFNNGMEYFNTFGGNPVSCAIGLAVLQVIRDEKLQENAFKVGEHMKTRLKKLLCQHELIGDVRGLGLYLGIELVTNRETMKPADKQAYYISERMKEEGILTSVDGPLHNVIKIKPPLVFTEANADLYVETLEHILYESKLKSPI